MWGDMSLWNVQGPLLHSGDHIVPRILTVDYTFKLLSPHDALKHHITSLKTDLIFLQLSVLK